MIATSESTIHQAVVTLLVRTGKGRIEAESLWDRVYSTQFHQAQPGHTYTWVIGQYEFEFTKNGGSNGK